MATGFGIVGCGMIANFHALAVNEIRGANITACFDAFPAAAERFAEANPGVTAYATLEQMLQDSSVDIVTICTPSGAHRDPAVAAAAAGKHVVVEKPLEITLKRCDAIIDACRKNRVQLTTIFPSRYHGVTQALKTAIDSGRFGKLTLADSYVKWWRTQEYYDSGGWRGTWALDGGGAYMNQAIHSVDLIAYLMGNVAEVTALTDTLAHKRIEVEDTGVAAVRFANGALGTIEATTAAYPGFSKKVEIHGTQGTAVVEEDRLVTWNFAKGRSNDAAIIARFGGDDVGGTGASDPSAISFDGHTHQLKDFIRSIRTGSKPLIDAREGRRSVEIILAIYQSAWTRKTVSMPLKRDPRIPAKAKRKK
ncbi:MAG: Gfo/Idh/MocA family oxidoreductase [Planctomycetaceae bacterium]|jgi:predicted dehydrogenase